MDDIQGDEKVTLYPGTVDYPIRFTFNPCSSPTRNDGAIPFGAIIAAVSIQVLSSSGVDYTTLLAASCSLVNRGINCLFSYPTDEKGDNFLVYIILELSTGTVIPKKWEGLQS